MESNTSDRLRLVKGQYCVFNDVKRKDFFLAEVLEVLPDYEYKIRFQIETQTGFEAKEQVVIQRYIVKLSRFMESVEVARRSGL
ncbi:hypothetical protein GCM10023189_44530 [Nibrella saemangeumensis]|uniref:DUF4377 domain-containing protein n=1 Tax=Nibrella saemangeumensis TaxID=1084526 RepID=A0ABP8NC49_9BACT